MSTEFTPEFELEGSIWFKSGNQNWGNPRRMALLAAILKHGSISAAAREINLSYKAAWDAVDTINNLSDEPLILRTTGGQRGGGAELTPRAQEILDLYQHLDEVHQRFMKRLARAKPGSQQNMKILQNMMVQTSARNNFVGTVSDVTLSEISAQVRIQVGKDLNIVSSITREAVETLGLTKGVQALAFIKASSIIIGKNMDGIKMSARNVLKGKIVRLEHETVGAEVGLELPTGQNITATITAESMKRLELELGQEVVAMFKASSVLLGILD